MRDVILLRGIGKKLEEVVGRAADLIVKHSAHDAPVIDVVEIPGWALVQGQPRSLAERDGGPYRGRDEAFAYTGYVAERDTSAEAIRGRIRVRPRFLGLLGSTASMDSPGGIAAYFLVTQGQGFAWSSHAGVEGVFYTEQEGVLAISNRPLLSHLVASRRTEPVMSTVWARRILCGDSSLWGDTPFDGTRALAPRSLLFARERSVDVLAHPVALPHERERHPDDSSVGVRELESVSRRSMAALYNVPEAQLHLSGGKDSRMVAALAVAEGVRVDPYTVSPAHGGEGIAAGMVATALDLPHRLEVPTIPEGEALTAQILTNLRRSDGLLGENRQLAYPSVDDSRPLLQGQAHHPRGGFKASAAQTISRTRERLLEQLAGDSDLVIEPLGVERRRRINELASNTPRTRPADVSYWMYADWRPPLFQAPYLAIARRRRLVWPMMDERVLVACASLSTADRTTERAFFKLLISLSPPLASIPLYDDVWNFDRGGAAASPFENGAATRVQPVGDAPAPTTRRRRLSPEKRLSVARPQALVALHDLRCSSELRSWVRPRILDAIVNSDEPSETLGIENQRIVRFLWKIAAIGQVLDGAWLRLRHEQAHST